MHKTIFPTQQVEKLTHEGDVILVQEFGQFRVFRGMPPSGPDPLNFGSLGHVQNEIHIGVVVVVGAPRHWHVLVGQADIFWGADEYSNEEDVNKAGLFMLMSEKTNYAKREDVVNVGRWSFY